MALIAPEIGIDLGTSNTMVYVRGRGIVVSEPTIVVIDSDNKHNVRAVGDEAEILLGRTGDKLVAVRPLKAGSIVNFDMAEILLRYFIRKAIGVSHVIKPKVLVSVPCTLPMVARKAVTEAATLAGAKTVYLIEKPFAGGHWFRFAGLRTHRFHGGGYRWRHHGCRGSLPGRAGSGSVHSGGRHENGRGNR